jgi:hypothetical protein
MITGIFIYNLLPDSTLNLNVKFKTHFKDKQASPYNFPNHLNLSNQLELKGIGVAPEFSSQFIDFGKKRIGINYDSIISIKNTGNIASVLKFKDLFLKIMMIITQFQLLQLIHLLISIAPIH